MCLRGTTLIAVVTALAAGCGDIPLPPLVPGTDAGPDLAVKDRDKDGVTTEQGDCNDDDPGVHPGATEVPYDGIDQDCDGKDLADLDKDGFESAKAGGKDCDDKNPEVKPGGVEKCGDGIDQDCNGEDLACSDADLDGDKYSSKQGDCDDTDPDVNPGKTEVSYNGKDDDCNPATPDDDLDGDGFAKNGKLVDCDDSDKKVFPGAEEVPYDKIDQNCDGKDLTDVDKDGFDAKQAGGTDCDDKNSFIKPNGVEKCGDGIDQDCDGQDLPCSTVDADGDTYSPASGDCNDNDKTVNPGASEIPYNGKDDDCNAATPDDDVDGDGFNKVGGGDCNDNAKTIYPGAPEVPYDGVDQDCNGKDLTDVDKDGYPSKAVAGGTDCDDKDSKVNPGAAELPFDAIDQNCDGVDTITAGAVTLAQGPSISSDYGVASNGTSFLVAYRQTVTGDPAPYRIMAQLYSSAAAKLGTAAVVLKSSSSNFGEVRVASDGTGFLVIFMSDSGGQKMLGQLVSSAGVLTGSQITIHTSSQWPYALHASFAGGQYGISWTEWDDASSCDQVWVRLLSSAGVPQGTPQTASTGWDNYSPSLVGIGTGFLVTWDYHDSSSDIRGRILAASGSFPAAEVKISTASSDQYYARSAWDGTNALVIFYDYRDGNGNLYGQRVNAAGATVGTTASTNLPIATNPANLSSLAVVFCGGRYNTLFFDNRHKSKYSLFRQPVGTDGLLKDATATQNLILYASGYSFGQIHGACAAGKAIAVFYESVPGNQRLVALPFTP
jgi:hypothetical protein